MINIDDKNRQEEIYPTEVERYEPAVRENRRERESLMVSKRGEKKEKRTSAMLRVATETKKLIM